MKPAILVLVLVHIIGCARTPLEDSADRSNASSVDEMKGWTHHVLTKDQIKRQRQLLREVYLHDLAGKPVSDYTELLSLADHTQLLGDEASYCYNMVSGGEIHVPAHMILVVSGDTIISAAWPYGEY